MGYPRSTLAELESLRRRGQRPYGPVIVGDKSALAWAERNRFFGVDIRDCDDDLEALRGLEVIVRMPRPTSEACQRIAMTASFTTLYDTHAKRAEYFWS